MYNYKFLYIFTILSAILLFLVDGIIGKSVFLLLIIFLNIYGRNKVNFRFFSFGLYLSFFIVLFSFIIRNDFMFAFFEGLNSFIIFCTFVLLSINMKQNISNKELAYCISKSLLPFKIFGYNQNKMYTSMLLTLNQINALASDALDLYKFAKRDSRAITKKQRFNLIINLIIPFTFSTLKKNRVIAVSILNKGYNVNSRDINIITSDSSKWYNNLIIMIILLLEIIIVWRF